MFDHDQIKSTFWPVFKENAVLCIIDLNVFVNVLKYSLKFRC